MSNDVQQLLELAERCEKAEKPERALDMSIKAAVYGGVALLSPFNGEWCLYRAGTDDPRAGKSLERPRDVSHATWITDAYTTSLDAAMTLLGEGARCEIKSEFSDAPDSAVEWWTEVAPGFLQNRHRGYSAVTPALALTAAALRARAAIARAKGQVEGV